MRVTVIGSNGNLGRHLCEELLAAGLVADGVDRGQCDLSQPGAVVGALQERLSSTGSQVVVNCAAYTDVDGAEAQGELAYTVNALGAEAVARAARGAGVPVVHISTDFVFGGESDRPYDEFDVPAPRGLYARSKYAGEVLVGRAAPDSAIVRVEGLYGRGGRNFVSTLVQRLRAGQALKIDAERRVTPTWSRALSRQLIRLCLGFQPGVYHATCGGETTWVGYAQATCAIAAELGRPLPQTFEAVATAALRSAAPRPAMSVLESRMLRLRGIYVMPEWQGALREYLTELAERGLL